MKYAKCNSIEICYETFGDKANPAMLMIMGLGMQLTGWDVKFCKMLASKGYFVIRYDNRDCGLSTKIDLPPPDILAVTAGNFSTLAYRLEDMANDAIGLLDYLEIDKAHIVGASMGSMIAQMIAISHPKRVQSLVLMMGSTGDPSVGQPEVQVVNALLSPLVSSGNEEKIEKILTLRKMLQSPAYPLNDRQLRAGVKADFDRSYCPQGALRQLGALLAQNDRSTALGELKVPALVVHGDSDPMVDLSGGQATANAINGAQLLIIEGMGHDLPYKKWPEIIDAIDRNASR